MASEEDAGAEHQVVQGDGGAAPSQTSPLCVEGEEDEDIQLVHRAPEERGAVQVLTVNLAGRARKRLRRHAKAAAVSEAQVLLVDDCVDVEDFEEDGARPPQPVRRRMQVGGSSSSSSTVTSAAPTRAPSRPATSPGASSRSSLWLEEPTAEELPQAALASSSADRLRGGLLAEVSPHYRRVLQEQQGGREETHSTGASMRRHQPLHDAQEDFLGSSSSSDSSSAARVIEVAHENAAFSNRMPATPPLNNYDMQQEAWMSENDGLEHHDSEGHELEPYEVAAFEAEMHYEREYLEPHPGAEWHGMEENNYWWHHQLTVPAFQMPLTPADLMGNPPLQMPQTPEVAPIRVPPAPQAIAFQSGPIRVPATPPVAAQTPLPHLAQRQSGQEARAQTFTEVATWQRLPSTPPVEEMAPQTSVVEHERPAWVIPGGEYHRPPVQQDSQVRFYVDIVRHDAHASYCCVCREQFFVGTLRLGFMPCDAYSAPWPPPQWVHAPRCIARANLMVMHDDQVCFSPFIPAQECQRVQEDLSVQQMRSSLSMFQANPPRWVAAWHYPPAVMQSWTPAQITSTASHPAENPNFPHLRTSLWGSSTASQQPAHPNPHQHEPLHRQYPTPPLPSAMTQYWQQHHPQQLFGHRLQLQGPNLSRFGNFGGPRLPPVPEAPAPPPHWLARHPNPEAEAKRKLEVMLESLPVYKLTTRERESCVICCEPMLPGESVRRLPCLHVFHQCCIDKWLAVKPTCPLDNAKLEDMLRAQERALEESQVEASGANSAESLDRRSAEREPR